MRVALISDTHIPARAERIPDWVREEVAAADHTIHAGDFVSADALDRVRDLSGDDLTAVFGNMDPRNLGLDEVETVDLDGIRFVVVHGTGPLETYEERVADVVREHAADGPTVGVAGHTHDVHDSEVDGVRLLNPGSATGAAPAEGESMMVADVDGGDLDVTIHER